MSSSHRKGKSGAKPGRSKEREKVVARGMSSSTRKTNPHKVECSGVGLNFGYINQPIYAKIDVRDAGPGELAVWCDGPTKKSFCELRDHLNGIFTLKMRAQEPGRHTLSIQYDGHNVPGSPFSLRVSSASLVRADGPGLHNGVIDKHKGEFLLRTEDAGPGDIKVKIGGPKGAFKMKTKRENRALLCKFKPKETAIYIIEIYWSGDPLPGSPFHVLMCKTQKELDEYMRAGTAKA